MQYRKRGQTARMMLPRKGYIFVPFFLFFFLHLVACLMVFWGDFDPKLSGYIIRFIVFSPIALLSGFSLVVLIFAYLGFLDEGFEKATNVPKGKNVRQVALTGFLALLTLSFVISIVSFAYFNDWSIATDYRSSRSFPLITIFGAPSFYAMIAIGNFRKGY